MKAEPIQTAPIDKNIVLIWKDSGHFEDGRIFLDPDFPDERYHVLFDGERLNCEPTHWSEIPELWSHL